MLRAASNCFAFLTVSRMAAQVTFFLGVVHVLLLRLVTWNFVSNGGFPVSSNRVSIVICIIRGFVPKYK